LRTSAVCGFTKLSADLVSESFGLPCRTVTLDDPFGALEGMALCGVVANADIHFGVEGTSRDGTRRHKGVAHSR